MDRLAAMEAFVRVVDAGSFSGAAKQLRLGQPAVSKTIAQLEDRLGVRLLLRSTHRLMPTEAGRNFYERAKRAIEQADEAELAARGAAITLSGRLRFCAPLTFTRLHVMPALPIFLTEHPALDIDVVLEDRDLDLIAAGIDVALLIGRLVDSAATARKIGQCQRRVIGTPGYFEAKGLPQTPRPPAHRGRRHRQRHHAQHCLPFPPSPAAVRGKRLRPAEPPISHRTFALPKLLPRLTAAPRGESLQYR
jgi:DNA-binding transcriptional LysR family regulator